VFMITPVRNENRSNTIMDGNAMGSRGIKNTSSTVKAVCIS
jgi:hypothetical protein